MAASITVQNTIDYIRAFLNWANLTIGNNNEPAMSAANLTLQTITGPPFRWIWNRTTVSFLATQGIQDYNVFLPSFGYLETASVQLAGIITSVTITANVAVFTAINDFASLLGGPPGTTVTTSGCTTPALNGTFVLMSATPTTFTVALTHGNLTEAESGAIALAGPIKPLEIKWGSMSAATEQDRPTFISVQDSDESGINFQFRVLPVPNATYQVILSYQESAPQLTNPSNTWGVPDQLEYIYTFFMMYFMFEYYDDPRSSRYRQLAVASLLARQSGLSATDRNLFLGNFLPLMQETENAQSESQQGNQARGL